MNIIETVQSIEREYGSVMYCPKSDPRILELSDWWKEQNEIAKYDESEIKEMLENKTPLFVISQRFYVSGRDILKLAKHKGWIK